MDCPAMPFDQIEQQHAARRGRLPAKKSFERFQSFLHALFDRAP